MCHGIRRGRRGGDDGGVDDKAEEGEKEGEPCVGRRRAATATACWLGVKGKLPQKLGGGGASSASNEQEAQRCIRARGLASSLSACCAVMMMIGWGVLSGECEAAKTQATLPEP